jgi:putative intracellular protease/amidase
LFVSFVLSICFVYVFLTREFLNYALKKDAYDVIVIPGGLAGAQTISSSSKVQELLASAHKAGKFVAAICAGI